MPRELSKCREWEKDRRNRLNLHFSALEKLLPCYDPSKLLSKIDILEKSVAYVKELQEKLVNGLTKVDDKQAEEIKKLHERIKKLLIRNQQLTNLLKDASIKVPKEYGLIKGFKGHLRWSNKITPEQAKKLAEKEAQKENQPKPKKLAKKKIVRNDSLPGPSHTTRIKRSRRKKKQSIVSVQLCDAFGFPQQYYIVTNNVANNTPFKPSKRKTGGVVTSTICTVPKVTPYIKQLPPVLTKNAAQFSSPNLTTYILANNPAAPFVTTSTSILPSLLTKPTSLLLKPSTNIPTILVVTKANTSTSSVVSSEHYTPIASTFPLIRPKTKTAPTRTTQINKVPIPALTSKYTPAQVTKVSPKKNVETASNEKSKRKDCDVKKKVVEKKKRKIENEVAKNAKQLKKIESENGTCGKPNTNAQVEEKCDKVQENQKEKPEVEKEQTKIDENTNDKQIESESNEKDSPNTSNLTNKETEGEKEMNQTQQSSSETLINVPPQINVVESTQKNNTADESVNKPQAENPKVTTEENVAGKETDNKISKQFDLGLNLNNSELSNDIFSSLQVPIGGQNPESTSPTAAFLLAFPLVSSLTGVKVTEVMEEENSDSRHEPPTLLQIGTMDTTKTVNAVSTDSLTPNLLSLDNFSFFSGRENYYNFDTSTANTNVMPNSSCSKNTIESKSATEKQTESSQYFKESLRSEVTKTSTNFTNNLFSSTIPSISNAVSSSACQVTFSKYDTITSSHQYYEITKNAVCSEQYPIQYKKNLHPNYSLPTITTHCNTFNPFADTSKSSVISTQNNFSKPYVDPLYTSGTHYSYNHNCNNFEQGMYGLSKSGQKPFLQTNTNYNSGTYPEKIDHRKQTSNIPNQSSTSCYIQGKYSIKDRFPHSTKNVKSNHSNKSKPPINWMTTPDLRQQQPVTISEMYDCNTNVFCSSAPSYFNNSCSAIYSTADLQTNPSSRKPFDSNVPIIPLNSSQRNEFEENQYSWSPTKVPQFLDGAHSYVSTTLPTLVGDLALGTVQQPFVEQKIDSGKSKNDRRLKNPTVNYESSTNFLSVSQLVDNKSETKIANRRNNANRNGRNSNSQKRRSNKNVDNKESSELNNCYSTKPESNKKDSKVNMQHEIHGLSNSNNYCNWAAEPHKFNNRHVPKQPPQSNYSAEALIGNQEPESSNKSRYRQPPTYLSDNLVSYYPPIDLPQDSTFMQSNHNYQTTSIPHSFSSSVQSNIYSTSSYITSASSMTSTYLQSSTFVPDFITHEFPTFPETVMNQSEKQHKSCSKTLAAKTLSETHPQNHLQHPKKSKTKPPHENVSSIVDFGFLPITGTVNSPVLQDEFHTPSTFLPPPSHTQLYQKNPIYPKQTSELSSSSSLLPLQPITATRSNFQNFENFPIISNAGSSLTSFNLSAIFPEINKDSNSLFTETPKKNYDQKKGCLQNSVSFCSKSSTVNCINTSTSYVPN